MTNNAKQKKIIIAGVILFVMIIALASFWISGNRETKDGNQIISSNEFSNSIFTADSTNNGHIQFSSVQYHFSIITDPGYGCLEEPLQGAELGSFALTRKNTNTSELPNRDTPNGFNTAADDRIGIRVYNNNRNVSAQNQDIAAFISCQKEASPGSEASVKPEIKFFNGYSAIEAIVPDGIGSFSRNVYFFNGTFIVVIGSSDVPKAELYDIMGTFHFNFAGN